jgi:hypothetical protein
VAALVDPATGLANESALPQARPWHEPATEVLVSGGRPLSRLC